MKCICCVSVSVLCDDVDPLFECRKVGLLCECEKVGLLCDDPLRVICL